MANVAGQATIRSTTGRLIHWAFLYDLLLWFVSFGGEQKFRGKALDGEGTRGAARNCLRDRRLAGDDCKGGKEDEESRSGGRIQEHAR